MRSEAGFRGAVAAVAVGLLVAGCSAGGVPATQQTGTSTASVGTSTAVSATVSSGASGVSDGLVPAKDPWALATEYGLVSPDGEYVGPTDENGDPLLFEPIEGYGDFSDVDRFDVDTYETTRLVVACVNDHGFAVTLDPDGGVGFGSVASEQNQLAFAVVLACEHGLDIRGPAPLSTVQLEKMYAYMVALAGCLEAQGYSVADPPSLDAYMDSQGNWNPYDGLSVGLDDWVALNRACPQNPVGGYGAWEPGAPIAPMP